MKNEHEKQKEMKTNIFIVYIIKIADGIRTFKLCLVPYQKT